MRVREHIPLAPLTTFSVGGRARFFIDVQSEQDMLDAVAFARSRALPIFVLGGGSNIVISDEGFDGVVISIRMNSITLEEREGKAFVTADAGVVWDDLVVWAIEHGLSGIESLSGAPGTVGGAIVANVGAYGEQCSDVFDHADVLDMHDATGAIQTLKKDDCQFSYHDSVFSHEPKRYCIVRATFVLAATGIAAPSYRDYRFDLTDRAAAKGQALTLADIRAAVLDIREQKGALIMPGRTSYKCAGSFFHMPYVSPEQYRQIEARARALDAAKEERLHPWAWEQQDGTYKIAPGFLLEYTEFTKGYVRGSVGISPQHTLSIINISSASAADIVALAGDMQKAVENIFGVHLEREVEYVGRMDRVA